MLDRRYLKRRVGKRRSGERWYARVPVPKDLRGRFGKLEMAGVDRDRAALVVGHERGFTYREYNPEGLDVVTW